MSTLRAPLAVVALTASLLVAVPATAHVAPPDGSGRTSTTSAVATPDTTYTGRGFVLETNQAGRVNAYRANWRRRVCGIKAFGVWYSSERGMAVDAAGMFGLRYSFTYPQGKRRWTVKGADTGQVARVTGFDGITRDTATMRQRVKIRPKGSTKRWCTASKTFSGVAR